MPSASGDSTELLHRLQGLREQLGKKQTFESAVCSAQSLFKYEFSDDCTTAIKEAWVALLQRCMTLLRTRFTSPAYWQAGYNLFTQAQVRPR
jgi:E3 ubiquitin-protein ligase AIP2